MQQKKLKFKPHNLKDVPLRVKWLNDSKNNRYIGDKLGQKTTLKKQLKWFKNYKKDKNKIFFTIFYNDIPIGIMGLSNISKINKTADVFIMIGENNHKGKGFGKEAMKYLIDYGFCNLNLQKLNLGVIDKNIPAVKLYDSLGFKVEGILKRDVCVNGKFYNMVLMAKFNNL